MFALKCPVISKKTFIENGDALDTFVVSVLISVMSVYFLAYLLPLYLIFALSFRNTRYDHTK